MKRHIPYFSFYPADFMNGVRGLSASEVGVYTMLLCRIYEENGPVEYHSRRLATYCGMREATFAKVVETLLDLGKISLSDGMLSNTRAEAEIAKRAHDLENSSKAGKASAQKRQQNQSQPATTVQQAFNHTDTDTREEREANASPKKSVRGTRISPDWKPPAEWVQWAVSEGMTSVAASREADRFRDYWLSVPGANGVKLDWQATWRNWVRKAVLDAKPLQRANTVPQIGEHRKLADGRVLEWTGAVGQWVEVRQ